MYGAYVLLLVVESLNFTFIEFSVINAVKKEAVFARESTSSPERNF